MARDAYVILDRKTVIFWSRKCGNTSLAKWLVKVLIDPERHRGLEDVEPRHLFAAGQYRVDGALAADFVRKMGFQSFMLARNPYSRVASAFVNKFVFDRRPLGSFDRLESFTQRTVIDMAKLKQPGAGRAEVAAAYQGVSFMEFLRYIDDRVSRRGTEEPMLNAHWNTQVPFYLDDGFDYGTVMKLESLATSLAPLAAALQTKEPFPSLRSTDDNRPEYAAEEDLSELSSLELANSGKSVGYKNLLSPAAKALIAKAYEIDFRKLGYPV